MAEIRRELSGAKVRPHPRAPQESKCGNLEKQRQQRSICACPSRPVEKGLPCTARSDASLDTECTGVRPTAYEAIETASLKVVSCAMTKTALWK